MTAQEHFNTMVKEHVAPFMKQQGFKKSGTSWGLRGSELWGVVALQRNRHSTSEVIEFWLTLGVSFDVLNDHLGFPVPPERVPPSSNMQWHTTLELLTPVDMPTEFPTELRCLDDHKRWVLRDDSDIDPLGQEIVTVMQTVAAPAIRRRRNIESFIEMYESSKKNPLGWNDQHFAVLLLHAGRTEQAMELFVKSVRENLTHVSLPWRVKKLVELGLDAAAIEREARKEQA